MISEKSGQNFESLDSSKEKHLKDLQMLRHAYVEKIPPEKLPYGVPSREMYKCRNNFFTIIYLKVVLLEEKGWINSTEAKQGCEDFLKFYKTIVNNLELYKKEEIDEANKILDCLIAELSKT